MQLIQIMQILKFVKVMIYFLHPNNSKFQNLKLFCLQAFSIHDLLKVFNKKKCGGNLSVARENLLLVLRMKGILVRGVQALGKAFQKSFPCLTTLDNA